MKTFQELIECLEQASNQIEDKDNKIKELLNLIQNMLIKKKYEYDKSIINKS